MMQLVIIHGAHIWYSRGVGQSFEVIVAEMEGESETAAHSSDPKQVVK